ncbi:MAG: DUF58 domain-containing protein [Methanomassiliicoccales archaeon]|nr:DUF58 domain-containing protein [Methanomassiliicoccales archaeon]
MRSLSGAALLGMALALLFLGLAGLRWELISLLIPMAMLLYLSFLLNRPPIMDLRFSRALESERLQEGEAVEVTLTIENRGEPLDYVEFMDQVPEGAVVVEGRERFPLVLPEGATTTLRYRLRFDRRGSYEFGDLQARWRDPLMVSSREQVLPYRSRVLVLPKVQDLRRCGLRPSHLRAQSGNVPSTSLGPGMEFYCLREYQPGDSFKRINWKASARRDDVQVNDMRSERSGDVVILVDARTRLRDPEARHRVVDRQVDAAASIASYYLKERDRVGLLVLGETMEVVPLGFGRRQFYRVVDRLLATRPGELRSTQSINVALGRYFPSSSMVVAISPLEDKRIIGSLMELGGRGHEVFVLSMDTFPLEAPERQGTIGGELARRMQKVRREDLVSELGRYCRVVDWDPEVPLYKYLREGRASPTHSG